MTERKWRAVFSYPPSYLGPTPDSYGPERNTREEAEKDHCPRSEETLGWSSGIQSRWVSPWQTEPD